ncbi:uncharacterized protein LTR77_010164 [Saxophila tyrrhenica]|uniref:Uncharacterized protein n=1 Tax=Saxophila tyrrhenica TaxID=1690608 RepID=A0AAV9NZW6_9PEZI|nr:hypothetical protein LTR77_010164 [Saxophila tyrrhenica]
MPVTVSTTSSVPTGIGHTTSRVEVSVEPDITAAPTTPQTVSSDVTNNREAVVQQSIHEALPKLLAQACEAAATVTGSESTGTFTDYYRDRHSRSYPAPPILKPEDCVKISFLVHGTSHEAVVSKDLKIQQLVDHYLAEQDFEWELRFNNRVLKPSDSVGSLEMAHGDVLKMETWAKDGEH